MSLFLLGNFNEQERDMPTHQVAQRKCQDHQDHLKIVLNS